MDVDVQGAEKIRSQLALLPASDPLRCGYLDVFIAAPSLDVLRQRLVSRKKDAPAVIERRLCDAEEEVSQWRLYTYALINDDLDVAYRAICSIVVSEKHRTPII